ncbi:MAG: response regulator [Ktedonobacteraceae bacterium]|nr:response regulator [Ktedonobacteraceae bacterium]
MPTDTAKSDRDLLQLLTSISHIDLSQLDMATVAIQLGAILQSQFPHDFIDLTWWSVDGEEICLRETTIPGCTVACWPLSTAVQQDEPMLIDDLMQKEMWKGSPNSLLRSELLIPLHSRKDVIGVLELGSKTAYAFTPMQRQRARTLAGHLAPLLSNSYLLQAERRQREQLQALDRIEHVIASSLDVDEVFETFAEQAAYLVPHEAISVTLLSEDGRSLERFALAAATQIAPQVGEHQPLDETVAGLVVSSGRTIWTNDMALDERFRGTNDLRWVAEGFHSFISAPLRAKSRIIGALNVLARKPDFYTPSEVAMVEQVANAIAIFVDNMYLHAHVRWLAIAEERNRIARDIHDTLMQSLTTIILQLDTVEQNHQKDEHLCTDLQRVRQIAQRALAESRRHVWGLRPNALEERPLPQVLHDELEFWQQASDVPTRLFVRGEGELSTAVEVAILRIMQEALHNIYKYASAHAVHVDLEYNAQDVRLLINDDGVGFDPQQRLTESSVMSSGFGLIVMSERARAAGGQLHVSSWPGNGTRIEAVFSRELRESVTDTVNVRSQAPLIARILVVDDHMLIRQGLIELLKKIEGLSVIGEAGDGDAAVDAVRRLHPDLVLMDMRLPGIDGAAATKQLLSEYPDLHIIMLTNSDDKNDLARAIEAGAHGYILKEASIEQLAETIRAVLRGEAVVERRITRHLFERFNHLLRKQHQSDELSVRELEVLRLVVEGKRNKDIAEALVVSEHTVKSHISNIFQKLGVADRASAVSTALRRDLYKR